MRACAVVSWVMTLARTTAMRWLMARFYGVDLERLLDYVEDPDKYHDQPVDAEDVMP